MDRCGPRGRISEVGDGSRAPPTYGGSLSQAATRLVLEFAPTRNDHDPGWPACMGGSPSAGACLLGVAHALAEELNIEIDGPRKGSVYA